MSDLMDADDRRLIVQGAILCAILVIVVVILAAAVGLAWTVFQFAGGF